MLSKGPRWMRGQGEAYRGQSGIYFSGAAPVFRHVPAESSTFLPFNKILAVVHIAYVRYVTAGAIGPFCPVTSALPCRGEAPAALFVILLIAALRRLRLSPVILQRIGHFT